LTRTTKPRQPRRKQGRPHKDAPTVGREALIAATRNLTKTIPAGRITRLDIARAAGVDPALIRYYFGDKSKLLVAAVLQAGAELQERHAQAYVQESTVRDRITRRIFVLLETLYQDPSLHHLIIERIIHSKSKEARQLRHEMVHGTCKQLAALINEGVANGEFRRVDPRHLFLAIVGACSFPMGERALFEELIGGPTTEADLHAYAQFVADMFLDGLSAPASGKSKITRKRPVS
jgi:AcrR family transcriptional regulator